MLQLELDYCGTLVQGAITVESCPRKSRPVIFNAPKDYIFIALYISLSGVYVEYALGYSYEK